MDFLRKKLEEVEGEMVATTGTPSRSLVDTSKQLVGSSWITRATAAASELQSVATKATTSLQEWRDSPMVPPQQVSPRRHAWVSLC